MDIHSNDAHNPPDISSVFKFSNCRIPCLKSLSALLGSIDDRNIIEKFYSADIVELPRSLEVSRILSSKNEHFMHLKLTLFEHYINLSLPYGEAPIKVVKDRVSEIPNFTYVRENIFGLNIERPIAPPPIGCNCEKKGTSIYSSNCLNTDYCCPRLSGVTNAYNQYGTLKHTQRKPIFECNSACSCKENCSNRIVQHLRKVPLCLFTTVNGKGWGVKTEFAIESGRFVMEYLGEVITSREAELRGKYYDNEGATYLFDLDFNDVDNVYTIDAKNFGNISHFVNHSCEPNLEVFPVWIDNLDVNLPHIALFSKKHIIAGSELTFDYRMYKDFQSTKKFKGVPCLCESTKCRKYLC
ncbi:hypothetical protein LOD99_7401 [Oopsacas minuta]|uniref:Histone-lysine N-methyltransferase n=1 Tax=Oopsacas minuta TaxID=111878 RepID=A0AAV7JUA6_9METZ|nr:hypothetical protein LOD99_7401 [Oopsacas minuta]